MSFYSNHVFPRLCHFVMSRPLWAKYRQEQLVNVEGEILEVGVGTGLNLPHYPKQVRRIATVDPNPSMNRLLRWRARETGIEVDQRITSGEDLPFDAATFDSVVSTMTLCSIRGVEQAVAEVFRVLKPGGRFFILEHGLSTDPGVAKWQRRLNWLQQLLGDGCRLDVDVRHVLAAVPFSSVEIENFYMEKSPRIHGYMYRGTAVK